MAKCIKCGKSTLVRGHVKLADGAICTPCFKSLGFKLTQTAAAENYSYDDIKNGPDGLRVKIIKAAADNYDMQQNELHGFRFADYGQGRKLNATDEELELYETICEILDDDGLDTDLLELVRKSDSYLTVVAGETDVIRFKLTDRVKWILFPYIEKKEKIRISGPASINSHASTLIESYHFAKEQN